MAHKYNGEYFHNSWCRHPRPNRPFGHCLIPAKCCPVTLNLAWCLVFKDRDMLVGGTIKVKVWVGILKGPRKRVLCSLMKARELPRGTHLPWVPTMCTALLYKLWGRRWEWTPPGRKPQSSTKQTPIYKFCCEIWTAQGNLRKVKVLVEKETETKPKKEKRNR